MWQPKQPASDTVATRSLRGGAGGPRGRHRAPSLGGSPGFGIGCWS
jgi:hypothetical protein